LETAPAIPARTESLASRARRRAPRATT
jgi:hypothetical protein